MANVFTSNRTHDPNGVYWNVCYTLDTGATVAPIAAGTIIKPLSLLIGSCAGTALLGKWTITDAADKVVAAGGVGFGGSSTRHPLNIPYMAGLKIVLNAIAGGGDIAVTVFYKYISGTAPTVQ